MITRSAPRYQARDPRIVVEASMPAGYRCPSRPNCRRRYGGKPGCVPALGNCVPGYPPGLAAGDGCVSVTSMGGAQRLPLVFVSFDEGVQAIAPGRISRSPASISTRAACFGGARTFCPRIRLLRPRNPVRQQSCQMPRNLIEPPLLQARRALRWSRRSILSEDAFLLSRNSAAKETPGRIPVAPNQI